MTYSSRSISQRTFTTQRLREFRVAVGGCAHCEPDNNAGRKSYRDYLREITSPSLGFDPDYVLNLGDFFSSQNPTELATNTAEGVEIASQLNSCAAMPREKIYTIPGNHCAGAGNYDCYNRYVDDFGNNTAYSGVNNSLRPYPISGVENEHHSHVTGNVLWLMLCDRNEGSAPWGRSDASGGHPSGSVLKTTVDWIEANIVANPTKIIIICHHNLLKDTTIATGDNEGVNGGFHGTSGQSIASGRLENIILDVALNIYEDQQTRLQNLLTTYSGRVTVWAGAHTHTFRNEVYATRGWYKFLHGTHHVSAGGLTRHHGTQKHPQSLEFRFTKGSTTLRISKVNHGGYFSVGIDPEIYVDITLPFAFEMPT